MDAQWDLLEPTPFIGMTPPLKQKLKGSLHFTWREIAGDAIPLSIHQTFLNSYSARPHKEGLLEERILELSLQR